ncbi:MAG: hypothetical protein AAGI10_11255 [Pseudomonadota bacterium]
MDMLNTTAGLWLAVLASGLYHGINPGMGWPLAVSSALFDGRVQALWRALAALGLGHLIAMVGILLPFAVMFVLVDYQREIQLGAACVVIAMGVFLLIYRRHPRFLSRVKPSQLALWSFLVAMAHGAGLMLVPIYLGLCGLDELDTGHRAAASLMGANVGTAFLVGLAHTAAMVVSGGAVAWAVHKYLGLNALRKTWFNLDVFWALSLIAVGVISILTVNLHSV